jgi:membrane protease YdiL (CAAX protease family)
VIRQIVPAKTPQRGKLHAAEDFQPVSSLRNRHRGMDPSPERPSDSNSAPSAAPLLDDRWAPRRGLPLDGPLERASFSDTTTGFLTGLLVLGATFLLFQLVVSPVILLVQIALSEGGMQMMGTMSDPSELLATYTRELIISNSGGQLLGLAVPALMMARLHSTRVTSYLRIRAVDGRLLLLAVVGVVGLQPVVQWLAQINKQVPLPEAIRAFEQTQLELIQTVLESGLGVSFNLIALALIPAFCEELLFRGYAQRQFERASGAAGGILLSGILFGFYHLRPSQFLPLALLGLYLAYLTWRTGSLWPAILVHLFHNGLAVLAARYVRAHQDYEFESLEQAPMPWYAVLGGFAIFAGVLYVLHPLARRIRDS